MIPPSFFVFGRLCMSTLFSCVPDKRWKLSSFSLVCIHAKSKTGYRSAWFESERQHVLTSQPITLRHKRPGIDSFMGPTEDEKAKGISAKKE